MNRILLQQMWQNKWALLLAFIVGCLLVAFDLVSPWSFKLLIDNVLSNEPLEGTFGSFIHGLFPSKEALGALAIFMYGGDGTTDATDQSGSGTADQNAGDSGSNAPGSADQTPTP